MPLQSKPPPPRWPPPAQPQRPRGSILTPVSNCWLAETNSKDFWQDILDDETFKSFVKTKYTLSSADMISDNEIDAAYEELGDE